MRKILKSEFFKDSSLLISSGAIGQIIAFLCYPVITRIYSDINLGELGIYLTYTNILGNLLSLRYEQAIHIPKKENIALRVLYTAFISVLIILPITALGLFLMADLLGIHSTLVLFILAGSVITASARIGVAGNNRLKKYQVIGASKISNSGGSAILQIAYQSYSATGILLGKLSGDLIAFLISIKSLFSKLRRTFVHTTLTDIWHIAREYKKFPLANMPHALLNAIGSRLPVILLTSYLGVAFIGQYELAYRISFGPTLLLTGSLYLIFTQKFSQKAGDKEDVASFFNQFVITMFAIGSASLILIPFYDVIFITVFGSKWSIAATIFTYLLPTVITTLALSPVAYVPQYFGYQTTALFWELGFVILRSGLLIAGAFLLDGPEIILLFSVGSACYQILQLGWIKLLIRRHG